MDAHLAAMEGAAITVNECQCVARNTPRTASKSCTSPDSSRISSGVCCSKLPGGFTLPPRAHSTVKHVQFDLVDLLWTAWLPDCVGIGPLLPRAPNTREFLKSNVSTAAVLLHSSFTQVGEDSLPFHPPSSRSSRSGALHFSALSRNRDGPVDHLTAGRGLELKL